MAPIRRDFRQRLQHKAPLGKPGMRQDQRRLLPDDIAIGQQIEIEGDGAEPFSRGGDSGSLVVDAGLRAAALLFAGGDQGGSNGQGLTYASPIGQVYEALDLALAT